MTKPLDLNKDWLNSAALSPTERQVWNSLRSELGTARDHIQNLEDRIRVLENQPAEEVHSILSRPEFNREVARMLSFDDRYGGVSSVLYFDFENIEDISNQNGKAVANATLRHIGDLLIKHVRQSDVVGRLAPDEFGVLLMRCDNIFAWRKAEHLATLLHDETIEIHNCKITLDISYGAYTFSGKEDVANGLKEAAHAVTRFRKPPL